jgi:phosphoribosyl 1,2-cyclic phosphodiesterase
MGRLTVLVLGSAAGGGFPQWNCRCATCRLAWAGDVRVRPRAELGGTLLPGSPADFNKLIAAETEKWGKVVRAANMKPD